jgi:hypothetical protein
MLNTPKDINMAEPVWHKGPLEQSETDGTTKKKQYIFSEELFPRKPILTV